MGVEIMELVWQDVSIRNEIILIPAKSLLHLDIVVAKPILSCDLIALWKVIDPLEFIEAFIQVAFARTGCPKDVPLVRISEVKAVGFKYRSDQLCVTFQELVKHLAVINVVATARSLSWGGGLKELSLCDRFDVYLLIESVYWCRIQVL